MSYALESTSTSATAVDGASSRDLGILAALKVTAMGSPNMSLLRVSAGDLPFIMTTERSPNFERFVGRWSEDEHRAALASPDFVYFLGKPTDARPIGFVILRDLNDMHGNTCLMRIAVSDPGQGFGTGLLRATVDWVFGNTPTYRLWLDVLENNARAKYVYDSLGFVTEGLLRRAYKIPGDERVNLIRMSILKPDWNQALLSAKKV